MLNINKFKFGLKENAIEISKGRHTQLPFSLLSVTSGKKSKKNVKILATIGPKSCSVNSIKTISKYTDLFRINGSHNTLDWHLKISKRIKAISPESFILLDIPGLKPRTNNKKIIHIKKGQVVTFSYGNIKVDDDILSIKTTKPLPKINKCLSEFSLSDGQFIFSHVKNKKNLIQGISKTSFKLMPQKGLNIPNSYYDNLLQEKQYLKFLKKAEKIQYDGIGLSFIQEGNILLRIKSIFKNKILVSKIENLHGLNNAREITKNSDLIMIDRGDLLAEVGSNKLFKSINQISENTVNFNKPLIMATENLESMQTRQQPSKSEIIALEHSIDIGTNIIMLSDETATSHLFSNTLSWLNNFLQK